MFEVAARVTCTSMLTCPSLTLKEESKVKFDITKRFAAYGFPKVDCTLETSRTINKWDISTFMLTCPSLTLKEESKVKFDSTKDSQHVVS